MTSRERILKALHRKAVDRIPWTPLIDGYYLSNCSEQTNQVDAVRAFGGDVFARHIPTYRNKLPIPGVARIAFGHLDEKIAYLGNTVDSIIQGKGGITIETRELDGVITQNFSTPLGSISNRSIRTAESPFIPFPKEHLIKTAEDIKVYSYVIEHMEYEPFFDMFIEEDRYIGDDGIATTTGPSSPFHVLMEGDIGMENFYYLLMDEEQAIVDLMELMHQRNLENYRLICSSPAEVIIDYENTSTTTMSPSMYQKYCQRHIDDYAELVQKSGKIFLTHMCGTLKLLDREIAAGKMDGVVDIAPPPTGDVPLQEAVRMWGADKLLMGGIDPGLFRSSSTGEIKNYLVDLLRLIASEPGVFLGSADATPIGTPLENLSIITDIVNEYGRMD